MRGNKIGLFLGASALGALLAGALLTAGGSSQAANNNTVATVDSTGYGQSSSIAIGSDGFPIISYNHYTLSPADSDLKIAHCEDASCTSSATTVVDPNGGAGTSIAIGTDGLPIVTYGSGGVKALHCGNVQCTSGNVITALDSLGGSTSMAIGSDGLPVAAYYDSTQGTLDVAHCGTLDCTSGNTVSTADPGYMGSVGFNNALTIGSDGLPVISYEMASGGYLRVTHCGNVLCNSGNTATTVDPDASINYGTSIAVGTDGLPIISYYDYGSPYDLFVAHCGNVLCNSGNTINSVYDTGGSYNDIAIGSDGLPVMSGRGNLGFITHCGDVLCSGGTVHAGPTSGGDYGTSLAIGADGLPIMSYSFGVELRTVHCGDVACGGLKPTPTPTATATPSGYDPSVIALAVPTVGTINYGQPQTKKVSGTVKNQGTHVDAFTVTLRVDYNFDFEADWVGLAGDTVQNNVFCSGCPGAFYSQLTYTELGGDGILPGESVGLSRNLILRCPAPNFSFPESFNVTLSAASSSGIDDNPSNSSISASRTAFCTDPSVPTATPTRTPTRTPTLTPTITPTPTITDTPTPKDPDGDTDGDTVPNSVDTDDDNDGCPDVNELQTAVGSELSGGRRSPHNPYDYFDASHNGQVRINDIVMVVNAYFMDDNDASPGLPPYAAGYNPATDRTRIGPKDWNLGPPNGLQRVDDILNQLHQYYHDCP